MLKAFRSKTWNLNSNENQNFLLPFLVLHICLACSRCSISIYLSIYLAIYISHIAFNWYVKSILASADPAERWRVAMVLPQIIRTFFPPQFTSCSGSIKNKFIIKISSQLGRFWGAGGDSHKKNQTQNLISSLKSDLWMSFRFADWILARTQYQTSSSKELN